MSTQLDQMPRDVAIALLTSGQRINNTFRKVCMRATWRTVELPTQPPNTRGQRLLQRLRSRNARQLHTWSRREKRRGERLQDLLSFADEIGEVVGHDEGKISALKNFIEQSDTIGQAITQELDRRSNGGKLII